MELVQQQGCDVVNTLFSGFIEGAFHKKAIARLQQRSTDFLGAASRAKQRGVFFRRGNDYAAFVRIAARRRSKQKICGAHVNSQAAEADAPGRPGRR